MKKYAFWIVLATIITFYCGYWFGNEKRRVEMVVFPQGDTQERVISISDRLYDDMKKCSDNYGVVSVYHSSFESELVCYNGQEFIHRKGEWRMKKELSL